MEFDVPDTNTILRARFITCPCCASTFINPEYYIACFDCMEGMI